MGMFYEQFWEGDSETLGDFELKWPKLSQYIPKEKGVNIVDFGCGKGEMIGAMKKINPNAHYMGLDVSLTALEYANKKYIGVSFKKIEDGGPLPVSDGFADLVFTSEVVEHIYDTNNAFRELGRITKRGGAILLTTPHHGFIKNLMLVLFGFDTHFSPTGPHVRFFTNKSLFALLEKNGFEIQKFGYYGRFYPVPHSVFVLARKK